MKDMITAGMLLPTLKIIAIAGLVGWGVIELIIWLTQSLWSLI